MYLIYGKTVSHFFESPQNVQQTQQNNSDVHFNHTTCLMIIMTQMTVAALIANACGFPHCPFA